MKRFCDTDRWIKDVWFCELEPRDKLFWMFILDQCDNVGVWEVNMRIANILTGYEFKKENLLTAFGEKIHIFDDGKKWWIPSFIDFQHGVLDESSASKPIKSYISLLEKHTLWIEYANRTQGVQGKGKGKGKGNTNKKVTHEYPPEFENWWKIFKKGNKAKALIEWRLIKDLPENLNDVTAIYRDYCKSADRPVLDGERFLKYRSWETDWTHDAQGTKPDEAIQQTEIIDKSSLGFAEGGRVIRKNPDGTKNKADVEAHMKATC